MPQSKAIRHRVATLIVPYSLKDPQRVFSFLDDQGYDCDLRRDQGDGRQRLRHAGRPDQ